MVFCVKVMRTHKRSVPKTRNFGMRNRFSGAFDDGEATEEENSKFSDFHVQSVNALLKLFLGSRDLAFKPFYRPLTNTRAHRTRATVAFNHSSFESVMRNATARLFHPNTSFVELIMTNQRHIFDDKEIRRSARARP